MSSYVAFLAASRVMPTSRLMRNSLKSMYSAMETRLTEKAPLLPFVQKPESVSLRSASRIGEREQLSARAIKSC